MWDGGGRGGLKNKLMTEIVLLTIITIYSWIIASFIMLFIAAIARFYQKKFGEKTFYYLYFVPILVIFTAIVNIYLYDTSTAELVDFIGIFISFIATLYLYNIMIGVR